MKLVHHLFSIVVLLGTSVLILRGHHLSANQTTLTPGAPLQTDRLPRYGLNLGGSGSWGAEQLRSNVLLNPGLEAVLDRTIVIASKSSPTYVVDDTAWLARPDGFWNGATMVARSGLSAGRASKVMESHKLQGNGAAAIWLNDPLPGVGPGDVLTLTKLTPDAVAPQWWKGQGQVANAPGFARPGSPGRQSVRLMASPGQPSDLLHYLDNIGNRAGKLLPVKGPWRLEFWARSLDERARLHVYFGRSGQTAFLDRSIAPGKQWQRYQLEFTASDDGPASVLTLSFSASDAEIQLDDVYLGESNPGAGGFRQAVASTLKGLKPGFLRDWQGQLGDTLDNRLADAFGHHPTRYRPGESEIQHHYSLPDFLALCSEIGAQPWIVAPTTLDDEEWRRFGSWLRRAADAHGFHEVLIEFGNENWNALFRPGGIPDPQAHAAVADRAFQLMADGSQGDRRFHYIVNAQFVNPSSPETMGALSQRATEVAVAPYFMYRAMATDTPEQMLQAAFSDDQQLLEQEAGAARRQGKQLSVYEVNFHTTLGNASASQRNQVLTGAAAGAALARRLLQGTLAGVRSQAVYVLSGFDTALPQSLGLARMWGITRDLAEPHRLRPTGIALSMLNQLVKGSPQEVTCQGPACDRVTALAFDNGSRLAIVSANQHGQSMRAAIPCPTGTLTLSLLDGTDPWRNNESVTQVTATSRRVKCDGSGVGFWLPPYSLATLSP